MTRKKVKLAFITNDSARKATYKKRKKGLMKKVSELSTLCGIDACAIIYSPYETQPEVWPNNSGAQRVLAQFKRMPEMEQSKKMVNQESFIRQRIGKANEQLKKQCKENREKEMTEVMYQCLTGKGMHNLIMSDLNDLGWLVDQNLKEIYKRVEVLKKMGASPPPPLPPPQPPSPLLPHMMGVSGGGGSGHEVAGRVVVHGLQEEKPVVDSNNMEQGTDQGMQRTMTTTHWFTDWMNNPINDQNMGFGIGDEMVMPFGDNPNRMWSNAFFP